MNCSAEKMKLKQSNLPKTETYPCSKRELLRSASGLDLHSLSMGWPHKHFRRDSQCHPKTAIHGVVVADALFSQQRSAFLSVYAVREDAYPDDARDDFRERVLPALCRWVKEQMTKPETALLGHEKIIAEWTGKTHAIHYAKS